MQRVGYTGTMIMGGTFTLTHDGETTSPIAYNATAATVKSALEALSSIGSGNVEVVRTQNGSFTYEWQLTFQGSKAGTNVVQSTINTTSISAMGGVTKIEATDTTGGVFDEVQTVTVNNATGGVFRLAFMGQTTAPIAYNSSAATVETALESLNSVDNVSVSGSAGGPWTITFAGSHAGHNVSGITGDASMLTNGTLERTMSFVYDAASQLASTTDPDSTYTYSYDALGRVTNVDNDGTSGVPRVILASAYDAASNRTSLSATIAGTADFKNDYTYDALHRLTRLDQTGQGGGNAVAEKRVDFAYNGLGQFTAIARYKDTDGGSTHEVATSSFTFDTLNRLTDLEYKKGGVDIFTPYSFSYDTLGRITSTTNQDGTTSYSYDKTFQLTAADHSYQTDESYSFDANGNRTMTGYTTGSNNRLTSDGTYNYTYDNEGNRTLRTKISDGSKTEYGWDYRNRLIRITEKTSGGTVTKESLYTYDQFDRRLSKSVDPDGPGGASAVTSRFIYEGDNIILVFGGSSASDLKNRYLHGPAVDQILADEQVTSLGSAGSVLWPLADNQGTIRDLVNSSGAVQNHLEYDSFGAIDAESNAAVDHLFGYTGRERDEESGLGFYRSRYYDSATGRFISHDTIGFVGRDANLSRYVGNNPTNLIDPTGNFGAGFNGPNPDQTIVQAQNEIWEAGSGATGWIPLTMLPAVGEIFDVIDMGTAFIEGDEELACAYAMSLYISVQSRTFAPNLSGIRRAASSADELIAIMQRSTDEMEEVAARSARQIDEVAEARRVAMERETRELSETAARNSPDSIFHGACFLAGTIVHAETKAIPIEFVTTNDRVWAFNHKRETWQLQPVRKLFRHSYEGDLIAITTSEGESITATGNHPFWVVSGSDLFDRPLPSNVMNLKEGHFRTGRWVDARNLQIGDDLSSRTGARVTVGDIAATVSACDVFNLGVQEDHTYAVGASGILVHNKGAQLPRPGRPPKDKPAGTLAIDKHPKTRDCVHDIKDELVMDGVGPSSYVGIAPNGDIVVTDYDGTAEIIGNIDEYGLP